MVFGQFNKDLIARMVKEDYETIRRNSLRNYVVPGFISFMLHRSNKLTVRLYVVPKNESRLANTLDPHDSSLWIHDHRFAFECQTLAGYMGNLRFVEQPHGVLGNDAWGGWYKYWYTSALNSHNRQINLEPMGRADMELRQLEWVQKGESYAMDHQTLHRILVPNDRTTVMLFWEHERINKPSVVFHNQELPYRMSVDGLYQPIGEWEFDHLIEEVLDII